MQIVLIGYMGSGKSSIGKSLAHKLKIPFIDLDQYIAEKEQLSVTEIFKSKGEIYFRKKETLYLQEILNDVNPAILATGGGTPCFGNNIDLLKKKSKTIYLKTSINTLVNRLLLNKHKRPLISHISDDDLLEFIGKHLFERAPYYQQSEFVVSTDGKTIKEITAEIESILS
ncbi:MAG: shikimate kinase [Flavobacteriaceae bacterium]|nr:shikimate kinase [Flavobacteriaceae bacterium]